MTAWRRMRVVGRDKHVAYSLSIFGLGSVHEKLGLNGHCSHLHVGRYLLDTFLTLLTLSPMPAPCKMRRAAAASMGGCRAQRAASADGHTSWNHGSSSNCLVGRELCWGQPGFCLSLVCASALSLISAFHYSDLESFCSGPRNLKGIDCA